MPNLYPSFEVPALAKPAAAATNAYYGKAPAFDFAAGDFVLDGAGRVVELDGHNTWVQWCLKAVQTVRYAHPVYSRQHGSEVQAAMEAATNRRAAESEVARAVTECLLADARTRAVRDFAFVWEGDEVRVSCTVEPAVGSTAKLEVSFHGG